MSQFGKEIEMYAEKGLRSAAAWMSLGREVATDAKPRTNITCYGKLIDLYSRDQTALRVSNRESH